MNPRHGSTSRGFTLVELLVVISIVALLVSLLLPALGSAKRHAVAAACLSNVRQIAIAHAAYMNDFKSVPAAPGVSGTSNFWNYLAPRYMPRQIYCPLLPAGSAVPAWGFRYGQNGNIRRVFPRLLHLEASPSRIVLLAESYTPEPYAWVHYQITMFFEGYGLQSHLDGLNLVFADYHAELIKPELGGPYISGGNVAGAWAYSDRVYGSASNPAGYFYDWGQPEQY